MVRCLDVHKVIELGFELGEVECGWEIAVMGVEGEGNKRGKGTKTIKRITKDE